MGIFISQLHISTTNIITIQTRLKLRGLLPVAEYFNSGILAAHFKSLVDIIHMHKPLIILKQKIKNRKEDPIYIL